MGGGIHQRALPVADKFAGVGGAVFGDDIRNAGCFVYFVCNDAAAVDTVRVQDVGHAVVCNVSAEQFHTGGNFPFAVDIRNAREEKHAVVHISRYVFVDVGPYSVIFRVERSFCLSSERTEYRCDDPYFDSGALQGLCLQAEEDSVDVVRSGWIPRRND